MKLPGNMKSMMKQAEKMKQQMEQLQEKAGEEIIEVSSGGGMVRVSAKAKGEILSITIEDEIIESKDRIFFKHVRAKNWRKEKHLLSKIQRAIHTKTPRPMTDSVRACMRASKDV